jgi:hypothetical protein
MSKLQTNAIRHLSSASDNITLDSSGRVLLQNNPAWLVQYSGGNNVAGNATITWNDPKFTRGGVSFGSNTTITVPVSGYYQINVHINAQTSSGTAVQIGINIMKNGAIANMSNYVEGDTASRWKNVSWSCVLYLAANDSLTLKNNYADPINVDSGQWGSWSGHLISAS